MIAVAHFCLVAILTGFSNAFAQPEQNIPALRVNDRVLTTRDLEQVKAMFPLERFKTSERRTKLIEAIYARLLTHITLLEQAGMTPVSQERIDRFVRDPKNAKLWDTVAKEGFTPEGFAARHFLTLNYTAFVARTSGAGFAEILANIVAPSPENAEIARERALTLTFSNGPEQPTVTARAMLLENDGLARSLERRIRAGEDFARLARRYSLTRALTGGAISDIGDDTPLQTSLNRLEPELQVGIANFGKPGLIRLTAPFGRAWLVNILSFTPGRSYQERVSDALKPTGEAGLSASGGIRLTIGSPLFYAPPLPQGAIVQTIAATNPTAGQTATPTEPLRPSVSLVDPVVARVGKEELRLVTWFANELLFSTQVNFDQLEHDLPKLVEGFLTESASRQALPHSGAGAESGLEPYLAARANVSEAQLKYFYTQHRSQYVVGDETYFTPCRFPSREHAARWRGVFLFAPFTSWAEGISYQCDNDGSSEPPPLPQKPSRSSLTPIAGGYVTQVFEYNGEFNFVALYNFLPAPMQKPFALARNDVERAYRMEVARKRLPAFERELRDRTGAQNLLDAGWKEIEAQP